LIIIGTFRILFYKMMNNKRLTSVYPSNIYQEASWIMVIQAISLVLILPIAWCLWAKEIAGSLILGGGICFLPNLFLYKSMFKYKGAAQAKRIVQAFYIGEFFKIILTMLLFVFVLSYMSWVYMPCVFLGYIVLQLIFVATPVVWSIFKLIEHH